MSFGTPLAVLLVILFLVPGLLWQKAAHLSSPYAKRRRIHLLECLLLSCLNYLVALLFLHPLVKGWPKGLDLNSPESIPEHIGYLTWWTLLVFLLPIIGGFITGKLLARRWMIGFFRKFGISVLHPAPSGWDYAFARNETYWARIELTDGKLVEGVFDENSLASGEYDDRDIFIATVFEWNEETGEYEQLEGNAGALVRGDAIKSITFFEQPEGGQEQADTGTEPVQGENLSDPEKSVENCDQSS